MSDAIRHVTIRGRVQGVGYRVWVDYTATSLGLEGWVRNRRDGSVEAVFAGPSDIVEQMVERALQIADTAYVMQSGRMIGHGPARELRDSDLIRQAYLGASASAPASATTTMAGSAHPPTSSPGISP